MTTSAQTIRTAQIIPFPVSHCTASTPAPIIGLAESDHVAKTAERACANEVSGCESTQGEQSMSVDDVSNDARPNGRRGMQIRHQLTESVQPIKDLEDIQKAKDYLLNKGPVVQARRNYMMFVVNINNAVRISDLLSLRIKDVADIAAGQIRVHDETFIRESKTKKTRYLFFGPSSKEAIIMYLEALRERDGEINPEDHLFAGERRQKDGSSKAISRQYAWKLISTMGHMISDEGKELHLGTHSMRKTFGYQKIKQNPNDPMIVAQISEMYNHSSMKTTYRYLGIDTEEKRTLCTTNEL